MKKFLSSIMPFFMMAMCLCAFPACSSDDDDDEKTTENTTGSVILGTWVDTDGTDSDYYWMTFNSDGTGYTTQRSGVRNFEYTFSYDSSDGTGTLKYWFIDTTTVYTTTVTVTGSTMMMTSGNSTSVWKKK